MKQFISESFLIKSFVKDDDGNLRLSSIIVADGINKKHKYLMEMVTAYKDRLECLAPLVIIKNKRKTTNYEEMIGERIFDCSKNDITEIVHLTEPQIAFIVNQNNIPSAIRDFNLKLIFAFHSARTTEKE